MERVGKRDVLRDGVVQIKAQSGNFSLLRNSPDEEDLFIKLILQAPQDARP